MNKFTEPRSVKDVQSFLGLAGYFRKFVGDFAVIAKPLSDLCKKYVEFLFRKRERAAFIQLKQMLTRDPVLKIFRYDAQTELHCDASKDGYGAILFQKDDDDGQLNPVYYMSRKTSTAEQAYHSCLI